MTTNSAPGAAPVTTALRLTPLPSLFLQSCVTLALLYGLMGLLLITIVELGYLGRHLAVLVGLGVALLQFLLSPLLLDLSLRYLHRCRWVQLSELPPHLAKFLTAVCAREHIALPRVGLLDDGAPQAFTYGHAPGNARVVISRGLLELLTEEEARAVIAHEMGHVVRWDMLVMTVAQVVPLVAYFIYSSLDERDRRSGGKRDGSQLLALGAYVVYVVSEYVVLWFSRLREYYADEYAARITGKPNALAGALVKIGYGLVTRARTDSDDAPEVETGRQGSARRAFAAMGILDRDTSVGLVASASGPGEVLKPEPERVKDALQWDLWNPWARFYELGSTHPLIARRLQRLGALALRRRQTPYVVFDRQRPESYWDEFLVDLLVLMLPWLGLVAGMMWMFVGGLNHSAPMAGMGWMLALFGVGLLVKTWIAYGGGDFDRSRVAHLLEEVKVSAVRPVPATLTGTIIGRGEPGSLLSEDFVLRDATGFILLDYRQPLPFWDTLFGLLRAGDYQGREVCVQGWYRRAPMPYLEIASITLTDCGETRRCYTHAALIAVSVLCAVLGGVLVCMAA